MSLPKRILKGFLFGVMWSLTIYLLGAIGLFIWSLKFVPLYIIASNGFAGITRVLCALAFLTGLSEITKDE